MEIWNGKDKVGTGLDSQFPFPIKLEYGDVEWPLTGDEWVSLTPLRIPDQPCVGYDMPDQYETLKDMYEDGQLQLCVELETSRAYHGNGRPGTPRSERHPCRGGKFRVPRNSTEFFVNDFELGETYTFQMPTDGWNDFLDTIISKYGEGSIYFKIRGTYRMLLDGNVVGTRTGICSNTAKITLESQ